MKALMNLKIAVVGPPTFGWRLPQEMHYGGVERTAWRWVNLLAAAGYDVLPIGPSDCSFRSEISRSGLWFQESFSSPSRHPVLYAEDVPAASHQFSNHVVNTIREKVPDVVMLLGPSAEVLGAIVRELEEFHDRLVVVLHNGPSDNRKTIPILVERLGEAKLVALSNAQRSSFGNLASRLEVVTDGIPVDAIGYSPRPDQARARLAADSTFSSIKPLRGLISQVDYFHPGKGMLITLAIYNRARMYDRFDLILAGGMGWQIPHRQDDDSSVGRRYVEAIRSYIQLNGLETYVHLLGELTGAQTSRVMQATDLAVSPVHMNHESLFPAIDDVDYESYGQSRAIANAAGTPVLMSDRYDPKFFLPGPPEMVFGSIEEGVSRIATFRTVEPNRLRETARRFAEDTDDFRGAFQRYSEIITGIVENCGHSSVRRPSVNTLDRAAESLIRIERPDG